MSAKDAEKTSPVTAKSFMAIGPTLHYSHENVLICWFLAMAAFALCCLVWAKIATGSFAEKVLACQNGGGVAAIIYNNEPGLLNGTLGGEVTTIPSIGVSDTVLNL